MIIAVCDCPVVCGSVQQCAAVCGSVRQCAAVCGCLQCGSVMHQGGQCAYFQINSKYIRINSLGIILNKIKSNHINSRVNSYILK